MLSKVNQLIRKIGQIKYPKNVLYIFFGLFVGQFISFCLTPHLSHIYSATIFGNMGIFLSISMILASISTLRYDISILNPKTKRASFNILTLCMIVLSIFVSVVFAVFHLLETYFELVVMYSEYIPISVFVISIFRLFEFWSVRNQEYRIVSIGKLFLYSGMSIFQVIYFYLGHFDDGLIFGIIASYALASLVHLFPMVKSNFGLIKAVSLKRIRALMIRYIKFPKYSAAQSLVNITANYMPAPLLFYLVSPEIAGFYVMAERLVLSPVSIIGSSIGHVFQGSAAKLINSEGVNQYSRIRSMMQKYHWYLLFIALAIVGTLSLLAPWIVDIFLADKWGPTAEIIQILSIPAILQFGIAPIAVIYYLLNKNRDIMIINIVGIIVRFAAIMFAVFFLSPQHVITAFALSGAAFYMLYTVWAFEIVGLPLIDYISRYKVILVLIAVFTVYMIYLSI